ncbi:MAG: hypothetical protein ACE5GA_07840 [Candidatus Zixiibacteriota bacterium]
MIANGGLEMKNTQEALEQLLDAWWTNNRINLFLIDKISAPGMKCTLSKRGGRNVCRQFAHMHNNRVWQLEKRARDLSKGLTIFATEDEPIKTALKKAMNASAEKFVTFFERCVTGEGKARCFKKGVISNLGYLIAHESHHRGSILLTLKERGHKLDKDISYAIWDWEKM